MIASITLHLIFQYPLELQPWLQAVDINEDVALAEISCDGQRVRGVIPPVVDKDFARHGWIMAWPPTRGAPTGPQFAGFLNGGNSGVSGANRASNGVSTLRFSLGDTATSHDPKKMTNGRCHRRMGMANSPNKIGSACRPPVGSPAPRAGSKKRRKAAEVLGAAVEALKPGLF
jgi:hypothetical protein